MVRPGEGNIQPSCRHLISPTDNQMSGAFTEPSRGGKTPPDQNPPLSHSGVELCTGVSEGARPEAGFIHTYLTPAPAVQRGENPSLLKIQQPRPLKAPATFVLNKPVAPPAGTTRDHKGPSPMAQLSPCPNKHWLPALATPRGRWWLFPRAGQYEIWVALQLSAEPEQDSSAQE